MPNILLLNIKNKFDRVVIIGGGFNAIEHKEAIKSFIETHTNTAIIFCHSSICTRIS